MSKIIVGVLLFFTVNSQAQFYYFPFPLSSTENKNVEKSGVKICYEYQLADGIKSLSQILEYGTNGLPAVLYEKDTDMNGDSIISMETIYKYNGTLKLSSETIQDMEYNDETIVSYSYDPKGRLLKKVILAPDPTTYIYSYDAAGRISKVTSTIKMPALDKDGEPTGKAVDKPSALSVYKYDAKSRLHEEWHHYVDEGKIDTKKPNDKYRWEYNNQKQIIKFYSFDIDGELTNTQDFDYNEKGLLLKRTVTSIHDNTIKEFIYEYCTDCKQTWMQ